MNLTIDNEFKTLIPELNSDELEKLKESILKNGVQQPLSVWNKDGELILIDGHNRYSIIQENNLDFKTIEFKFENRNKALLWIIDNQMARRNLNNRQKIDLATQFKQITDILKEEARKRIEKGFANLKQYQNKENSNQENLISNNEEFSAGEELRQPIDQSTTQTIELDQPIIEEETETETIIEEPAPEPEPVVEESKPKKEDRSGRVNYQIAQKAGVSERTVDKYNTIKEKASPEIKAKVMNDEISIDKGYKEYVNEKKKAEWQEKVDKQKEEIANNDYLPPAGKYDVIAIDPPWNYKTKYDDNYGTGQVACPYPEMSQEELKKLPIPEYCADDCCLFLWTTQRFLPDALELMAHWGFKYKNYWIWNKDRMGLGEFYQIQTEICLVGFKGKPQWRKDIHGVRDYALEHIRQHSRKPEAFYEMVDKRFTGYKLEWFSRTEREGWVAVGNDTQKFN